MLTLHTPEQAVHWLRQHVTGTLRTDSRQVQPGDAFIAWPGAATDGRAHVADALARGAAACLVEQHGVDAFGLTHDCIATLPYLKAATGPLAALWFDHPTRQLCVLAVTGTNGKTSTAWWLAHAWNALSHTSAAMQAECAVVGTLGSGLLPRLESTGMTTPDPVHLQNAFRRFADMGAQACAIEASSIGLAEQRLAGTQIRVAIFTNFTQDHLDYHGTMAHYWQAKRALFAWPDLQVAVVNIDDPVGAELHAELQTQLPALDLWSISAAGPARLFATDIALTDQGLQCVVQEGQECLPLSTNVIGHYNVLNLLGVIAALRSQGCTLHEAANACARLEPVPGRMQRLLVPGQPLVAVDYAHTPDALAQVLHALRPVAQERGGKLWCVFGCGGDRDASKRPLMGAVAQRQADHVVVTSDNPRSEVPAIIIHQIMQGMVAGTTVHVEPDRATAIAQVLAQADAADVVLIAGKGHEDTQEIAGQRYAFSDMAHAQAALQARGISTWA